MTEQPPAAPPVERKPQNQSAPNAQVKEQPAPARPRWPFVLVALVVVGAAGYLIWRSFLRPPDVPPNLVTLSGRIESDDSSVAAKTTGRIREITAREGDSVRAGQVIAVLEDDQVRARETQAQAAVTQAEARVRLAQQQIAVLREQLQQSQLSVEQSRTDAEGRVKQAEAQVAAAESQLAGAESNYRLAAYDREAYTKLAQTGAASERQAKQAQSAADAQAAAVAAARRQVEASKGALTAVRASLSNPDIRSSEKAAVQRQIVQQEADVAASQAEAARARAQLVEAQANRADLQVLAPFDGIVATRAAEPGEVATAGTAIITLLDLRKVYLRGFVPEGQIGRVRVGQPARIYLDSQPRQPLEAYVSRVDPEAAFTPENTYFREDRVKQVVGVKLQIKNPAGFAKPGMPADGEILVEGSQWPEKPSRK